MWDVTSVGLNWYSLLIIITKHYCTKIRQPLDINSDLCMFLDGFSGSTVLATVIQSLKEVSQPPPSYKIDV